MPSRHSAKPKVSQVRFMLEEPSAITGAQVVTSIVTAAAGALTLSGSIPLLVQGTVGPVLGLVIGTLLTVGGVLGSVATLSGAWWLERIGLLISGLGWTLLLPATVTFALGGGTPIRWLIFIMLITCLGDIFKRYRRIDWAYLDPTR